MRCELGKHERQLVVQCKTFILVVQTPQYLVVGIRGNNILSFLCCPDYVEPLLHWLVSNQRAVFAELQFAEQLCKLTEGHLALILLLVFLEYPKPLWLIKVPANLNATNSFFIVGSEKQFGCVKIEANVVLRLAMDIEHTYSFQHLLVNMLVVKGYPRSDVS